MVKTDGLDMCQKLVEDVILHLLTQPGDWRNQRDLDWAIGTATNLTDYIGQNAQYLLDQFDNLEFANNFGVIVEDGEEEYYEAKTEIFDVLREMFPTMSCIHYNDRFDMEAKFIPRLRDIYSALR